MAWIDKALLPGPSTAAAEASKQLKEQGFTWDWIEDSKRDITFTRLDGSQGSKVGEKDLPLYQKILDRLTVKDSNNRSWLNKGLLKDGVDKDDIWKTILASLSDAGEDILAGGLNLGESLADTSAMLLPALLEGQQKLNSKLGVAPTAEDIRILEEAKAKALAFKQKDLYDGNAVAREILSNLQSVGYMEGRGGYISEEDIAESQRLKAASKKYLDEEMESVSVLGEKLDSVAQSAGQLAVRTAANAYVPGAGWILSAASAFDDEVDNAIEEGANFEEMMTSGAISAAAEVGIEALSGGIKIGDKAATDLLVDKLAALIPKSVLRTGMKLGIEATGEGIEEVLTDAVSKFGQWLTYRSEEELKDIFSSEQALDAAAESFWSGLLMGGAFGTSNVVQSHAAGTDFVSGLTKNEETVVRKLVNDRLAEAKKNNEKVKKSDVYNEVIEAMDNGEISTDIIEEILGGKEYRDYKQAMDAQEDNDLIEEHTNLGNKKGATPAETTRYQEIDKQVDEIRKKRSNLKDQLSFGVSELVKNDRLSESYVQKAARGRTFNVDLTKVSEKQRGIYQKAMESGVINNTRRSHQFVDLVSRIAADKGIDFDFTNNERLKKSGFAVAGAHVNGFVNENGITINMQSAKVLNTVVGHEVTHVLEGTELYNELQKVLFDYAKPKGEYLPRFNAMKELYKDSFKDLDAEAFEAEINKEVTADLVGDLLFSDADFINQLYRGNRNVFEKLYDEIKYLCKVVTAGSKEARQLEKVKKAFADAYRMGEKASVEGTKYSLYDRPKFNSAEWSIVNRRKHSEFDNPKYDLDSDRKWMYAEEKGSIVFAIYSKHDADDPTVLYGSRGKNAERDYGKITDWAEGRKNDANRNWTTLDRLLGSIESKKGDGSNGVYSSGGRGTAARDVPLSFQEQESNGRGDYGYGSENLQAEGLTENDAGATEVPVAPVTFSNDYQTIRNFMKDDSGIGPVKYSLSDSNGRQLTLKQQEFFNESKVRDENGNLKVMYHGTPNGDFSVFRDGSYFTESKAYADKYQNPSASSIRSGKNASSPKTFEVYLDIKKPFDIKDPEARDIYINEYIKGGNAVGVNPYLSEEEYDKIISIDWTEGEDLREFLIDNGYDYDGLILDEGGTGGYGDEVQSRGTSYVVFNPEQVKNVDNLNPTSSSNIRYSLSSKDIAPVHRGNFNVTSEEVYLDPGKSDVAPVAANAEAQTDRAVTASAVSEKHEEEPRTPRDRAKKFFFDDVMSLDKMPEDFRKKHGEKWTALQRATESAQDLVVNGADGVKPLDEIYQRVVATNAFSRFESYMQHLLNMDAMSLNQRFGLKDKDVIGGVSAEMSRQEVAKLEKAHPEFKEIAEDIYAYNRYLRDVLVKSGKISEETADVWELRYPHYIPIKRAGFGNDFEISELLGFMIENMEQIPNAENMDGFFQKVEGTAPVKARKGSDLPIQPLFDTLTERAMQTYWAAAMTGADMHSLAPVRSDIPDQLSRTEPSTKTVVPENVQIETEKTSNPKILDVDGEIMRNGNMNPGKWFAEKILDNGFVFERISKKTGDRGLEAEWNFIRNARGAAQHLIGNGVEGKGVMALHEIYSNVQKTQAVKQFYEYLGHQRNVDSMTMRVRFGLPVNQTMMGRAAADSYDAIYQLEQKHPQFKTLAEETYKYAQNLLDNMVESGMLSKADADMIREVAPHWVPFNVVEGKIQPVFKTLADETLKIQHQIALNKFGVHLKDTLGTVVSERQMNLSDFLKSIDRNGNLVHFGGNARFNTMTVLDNGKSVTFEITDEMYAALKPTRDLLSASLPVASQVSTIRRNLITAYSPWFTVKNAIRDVQEVVINSQHPVKTYAAIPQAINEIRKKGEFYQEYVRNGGEHNTYFDSETGNFGPGTGVMTALETKTGLKYILKANEFVESVPRLAEYIASREAGASVEVAMLDAARVTTNFAAGGKLTKFLDRNGATFLNASVQGAMQQARNFAEAKQNGIKGWASLAARYAVLGLPAVLLNGLIWGDDEEYQALPDYITDNYYIVGKYGQGSFIRLPKGRTAAVLQDAIEQTLKMPEREANWKSFWKLFFENIAPNNPLEDNIIAPVIQVIRNKTWYGEDLVPSRLEEIDDVTQRFDEKTSRWATWLSERIEDSKLGDHVDLSPKQIHYLLDQYSGVLGDTILPFTTPKAESRSEAGNLIAPIRDIFTTNATLNNRVTGDFYDTLEAVEAKAEEPGATLSEKLMSSILIGYNVEISKLLQQQRDIQNSKMKASEKYDKNFELKERINALQKEALENYQNMRITGIYAEAAGKRYNYGFDKESGRNRWFEIKPKNADGTDNWYYQDEKNVTKTFGISPAEYWNNREAYSSAYYAANHWDDSYFETVRSVLGIDSFVEYAEGLTDIYADKDSKGNAISGSKKKKVKDYIYSLDIPDIEKHILYKAEYNSVNKSYNKAVYKYLESLGLSDYTMNKVLAELGMK